MLEKTLGEGIKAADRWQRFFDDDTPSVPTRYPDGAYGVDHFGAIRTNVLGVDAYSSRPPRGIGEWLLANAWDALSCPLGVPWRLADLVIHIPVHTVAGAFLFGAHKLRKEILGARLTTPEDTQELRERLERFAQDGRTADERTLARMVLSLIESVSKSAIWNPDELGRALEDCAKSKNVGALARAALARLEGGIPGFTTPAQQFVAIALERIDHLPKGDHQEVWSEKERYVWAILRIMDDGGTSLERQLATDLSAAADRIKTITWRGRKDFEERVAKARASYALATLKSYAKSGIREGLTG
jgi:hypothetical protein